MSEWQTMETAPTDGTSVLLLLDADAEDEVGQQYTVYAIEGYHSARAWRTQFHVTAHPIRWMPSPAHPAQR